MLYHSSMVHTTALNALESKAVLSTVLSNLKEMAKVRRLAAMIKSDGGHITTATQAKSSLCFGTKRHQLMYDIIMDHCVRAEQMGPGAFALTLDLIIQQLETGVRIDRSALQNITAVSTNPTWDELKKYLRSKIDDSFLFDVVMEALELSGLEGKIFFEKTHASSVSIELVNGFNFKIKPAFPVAFRGSDVKTLIVDGFVETVSEIHHLLQKFSETRENCLFVCRGMAADVINTLKVNFERKTLGVIPVFVDFDLQGVNTLADLALVCSTDVVSSLKGQLISTIKHEEITQVPVVTVSGNTLTIMNNRSVKRAQAQVRRLMNQRKKAAFDDIAKLFDERVKSLTPSCVKVRIPSDKRLLEYSESFDLALRFVRSTIKRGLISKHRLPSGWPFDVFPEIVTADTAVAALQFSASCVKVLGMLEAIVI